MHKPKIPKTKTVGVFDLLDCSDPDKIKEMISVLDAPDLAFSLCMSTDSESTAKAIISELERRPPMSHEGVEKTGMAFTAMLRAACNYLWLDIPQLQRVADLPGLSTNPLWTDKLHEIMGSVAIAPNNEVLIKHFLDQVDPARDNSRLLFDAARQMDQRKVGYILGKSNPDAALLARINDTSYSSGDIAFALTTLAPHVGPAVWDVVAATPRKDVRSALRRDEHFMAHKQAKMLTKATKPKKNAPAAPAPRARKI